MLVGHSMLHSSVHMRVLRHCLVYESLRLTFCSQLELHKGQLALMQEVKRLACSGHAIPGLP